MTLYVNYFDGAFVLLLNLYFLQYYRVKVVKESSINTTAAEGISSSTRSAGLTNSRINNSNNNK
jgi:hypothetical protein